MAALDEVEKIDDAPTTVSFHLPFRLGLSASPRRLRPDHIPLFLILCSSKVTTSVTIALPPSQIAATESASSGIPLPPTPSSTNTTPVKNRGGRRKSLMIPSSSVKKPGPSSSSPAAGGSTVGRRLSKRLRKVRTFRVSRGSNELDIDLFRFSSQQIPASPPSASGSKQDFAFRSLCSFSSRTSLVLPFLFILSHVPSSLL